jgi:hypothetical protein
LDHWTPSGERTGCPPAARSDLDHVPAESAQLRLDGARHVSFLECHEIKIFVEAEVVEQQVPADAATA